MSLSREARLARFHRSGPWVVAIVAILVLIVVEADRHHALHSEEALFFVVLIPTIIVHEVSHGVVAYWCGDDTAKRAGRLSANPIRHIDPIGTVLLPLLLIVTTGLAFGWAKPVPVRVDRLRHPRNQAVLVGLAGPATNVVIALAAGFAFRAVADIPRLSQLQITSWPLLDEVLFLLGIVNVIIAVFNLIPIPPLDGSAVVEWFLPREWLPQYYRLRMMSIVFVLFLVLVAPGVLDSLFNFGTEWWGRIVGIGPVVIA
ncbi:MAG TPA: site-2 protease family protein [Acidimicrobiales bacterium]|nr:site-2 protease family protein [Acidimicrobiales bacterium]